MNPTIASRSVTRMRHPLKTRLLTVVRVRRLSPHFVSVALGGADLEGFVSSSFDDHVKLMLPAPGQSEPLLPTMGPAGPEWPADGARPIMRDYTPRSVDPRTGELHIEIALHGAGPAADWAAAVAPGQKVGVGGPRGSFVIAMDYDWHLLIGDDSALPAIARRLEELPASSLVTAVIQLDDAADRREFESTSRRSVHWVPPGEAALTTVLRGLDTPPGEGFGWVAGESRTIRGVRELLLEARGLDKHHVRAAAYWKQGATAFHENVSD